MNANGDIIKNAQHVCGPHPARARTQERDFVVEFFEQVAQVVGHVVVEQKLHSEAGAAICLATSKSISPRWSS